MAARQMERKERGTKEKREREEKKEKERREEKKTSVRVRNSYNIGREIHFLSLTVGERSTLPQ